MILPAFCDTCGAVFNSGFDVENSTISFKNCKSGPCPNCGGMGSIPDAVFHVIGTAVHFLAKTDHSEQQFRQLQTVIAAAKRQKDSPEQLVQRIEREAPSWSEFGRFIGSYLVPKNAGEFWAIIAVILAAIPLINAWLSPDKPGLTDQQVSLIVEKAVEAALKQTGKRNPQKPKAEHVTPQKKIGRNAPCPCASGKKYKRCCGNPSTVR